MDKNHRFLTLIVNVGSCRLPTPPSPPTMAWQQQEAASKDFLQRGRCQSVSTTGFRSISSESTGRSLISVICIS
jgi:hypothetical protein